MKTQQQNKQMDTEQKQKQDKLKAKIERLRIQNDANEGRVRKLKLSKSTRSLIRLFECLSGRIDSRTCDVSDLLLIDPAPPTQIEKAEDDLYLIVANRLALELCVVRIKTKETNP